MADSGTSPTDDQVSITIKGQSDAKYNVTILTSATVKDLKELLASEHHANLPADRQRLIYSGRVLKDNDTIASSNIKSGHTVHMVRTAESNTRQNPAGSSTAGGQPAAPAVPTNIAAGTGNSPLAGLTGARYAGFHGLPSMSSFGADGGMQPPMSPEQVERLLENPMFVSQLTEFMNSPQAMQLMEPMFNENPHLREMMRNPEIRRMLFSPESIRTQIQISRMMGNQPGMGMMGGGARGGFPAPGVTDNSTGANQQASATGESNTAAGGAAAGATPANPFAALFGGQQPGGAGSPPAQPPQNANQFALLEALLGGQHAPGGSSGAAPSGDANSTSTAQAQQARDFQQQLNLLSMLGGMGGGMGGGAGGAGGAAGGAMPNYAEMFGLPNQPPAPADNRPPEERYAEQLSQLNEMGFHDFDRNVAALRRSGGNVQGAIEHLLSG